jgi:hypothetical protein
VREKKKKFYPQIQGVTLGVRKTRLRLKEQILTMKFKAYRHLWKEDVLMYDYFLQRNSD